LRPGRRVKGRRAAAPHFQEIFSDSAMAEIVHRQMHRPMHLPAATCPPTARRSARRSARSYSRASTTAAPAKWWNTLVRLPAPFEFRIGITSKPRSFQINFFHFASAKRRN
jgi:hypothetical protein